MNVMSRQRLLPAALVGFLTWSGAATAQEGPTTDAGTLDRETAKEAFKKPPYSPYAGRNFPTRPFFGDTHLHTSLSFDAGAAGCRLGPKEAYRFAKGEQIMASSGQPVKLSRPLDFLVVADHSDNMGFFTDFLAGKPELLADPTGRKWYDMIQSGKPDQAQKACLEIVFGFSQGKFPKALIYAPGTPGFRSTWREIVKSADEANEPGRFTAFIGYEWTSLVTGNNLHRNVIYRDDGMKASLVEPYTTTPPQGSPNPRDLWKWMAAYEEKTGGELLAIAHNGNLGNGTMFPIIESFTGKRVDREYVVTREKWERLYEATQMKGDGETHPFLSPNDEFANFERWDKGNLDLSEKKTARDAGVRVCPLGLQERPQAGKRVRRESLQVRPGRQHRRAHRPHDRRRGQLLWQDLSSEPSATRARAPVHDQSQARTQDHGLGNVRLRLRRRVGERRTRANPSSMR